MPLKNFYCSYKPPYINPVQLYLNVATKLYPMESHGRIRKKSYLFYFIFHWICCVILFYFKSIYSRCTAHAIFSQKSSYRLKWNHWTTLRCDNLLYVNKHIELHLFCIHCTVVFAFLSPCGSGKYLIIPFCSDSSRQYWCCSFGNNNFIYV